MEYAQTHLGPLSAKEVEKLAIGFNDVRLAQQTDEDALRRLAETAAPVAPFVARPAARLGDALSELRLKVAADLLDALASVSPAFFEPVVLDVVLRLGYGTNRTDLQRVGATGDGGIDGIISLDKLGLEKVYVQAKRWQQTVGRPEVQGF